MTEQRKSFGRALLDALANPWGNGATTTTNTFEVADAPQMRCPTSRVTFQPKRVATTYRNGRFRLMTISGPVVGHEGFHTIRRFYRERDVPEWARKYLGEDN